MTKTSMNLKHLWYANTVDTARYSNHIGVTNMSCWYAFYIYNILYLYLFINKYKFLFYIDNIYKYKHFLLPILIAYKS